MLTGIVELIALEVSLIEVEMAAVLQTEVRAAGEYQREIGITMAVAVGHPATEQCHGRAQQRLAVEIVGLCQPGEKVAELLDGERVILGELFHVAQIAAVVTELMARFGNADFRNGKGVSFAPQAKCGDACHIRLEGKHDQVIHRTEIVPRHGGRDIAIGPFPIGVRDGREGRIEPGIGPLRTDFCLTNRGQILIKSSLVCRSHRQFESTNFRKIRIQHAPFLTQRFPLDPFAPFGFFKQRREDFTATTHRG